MAHCIHAVLFVIALAICSGGSSGLDAQEVVSDDPAINALSKTASTAKTDRADKLFDQKKWAEARSLYDQVDSSRVEIQRHAVDRAIACTLKLRDWDDALRRVQEFKNSNSVPQAEQSFSWPRRKVELAEVERYIGNLEFTRQLLQTVHQNPDGDQPQSFQDRLTREVISIDFIMLESLDPDRLPRGEKWGWETGYSSMQWWWESSRSVWDVFDSDDDYQFWREGIPVDGDGKPIYLPAPSEYQTDLGRAQKILYLLDEVERLDNSESKSDLARSLLHRADLMRRLYGPKSDPAWSDAIFYYQYAKRPSFETERRDPGRKQFSELDDDQARVVVGQQTRLITLPPSENPIAIWRRIEKSFLQSGHVAEAIYRIGLYYQNRRQYAKAIAEYERLIKQFPNDDLANVAQKQIASINHADVLLGSTGVFAAGSQPDLWFACRNTPTVEFTARPVDLKGFLLDREKSGDWSELAYFGHNIFNEWQDDNEELAPFVGDGIERWSQTVPSTDQVASHSTQIPLTKAGAYLVEARVPGAKQSSKGLVILTGVEIIQKPLPDKVLLWAVDSRTGRPLPNQNVQMVYQGRKPRPWTKVFTPKDPREWTTSTTDQDGAIYFQPPGKRNTFFLLVTDQGDIAFSEIESVGYSRLGEIENKYFGVTDRPLYRPGTTVNFRVWVRELNDRQYRPAEAGKQVRVKIDGPDYNDTIRTYELLTDETGSVTGSLPLSTEAALGRYTVTVEDASQNYSPSACQFRVEEFKKPEFSVSVLPAKETARLGEPIKATIQANYYSGQPVSGAAVRYTVRRRNHFASYEMPSRWDWLYGKGFGDYSYLYPWLGDSVMRMEDDWYGYRRWYYGGQPPGELVSRGSTQLDENGNAEISIDTARFSPDVDHQFTIKAKVRDESRRTIEGNGNILATRQQFFAFTKLDRGWYQNGGEATVDINTRSANDIAVSTNGKLSLFRIVSVENPDDPSDFKKETVETWPVKTDADGLAKLNFKIPDEGQYRLEFLATDTWQQPVTSESTIWVHGPKFDGTQYRFGGLEIIPDKRSYRIGETAKLLINTAQSNARLLMVDSMENHRFIDIPNHTQVVEIPITAKHVPNFFFEATLVHDGRVINESCEVYVPPIDDLLMIELRPDQQIYKPGEKGTVKVSVTDADGNPVSGSMALTAYDKSLTYIQTESGSGPKSLLSARRMEYWDNGIVQMLGIRQFEVSGSFICPEFHLDDGSQPTMGGMGGAPPTGGDPSNTGQLGFTSSRRSAPQDPSNNEDLFAGKLVEPNIRADFSDSAAWLPNLQIDDQGTAIGEMKFPESLTTWRVHGYLVTPETKVGDAICEIKTNKNLLVRLQAPRFFVESDEVVLSANVQNDLADEKDVSAELILPAVLFKSIGENPAQSSVPDGDGHLHLVQRARVKPGETHRFDWPMQVQSTGLASITVKAKTDVESDAMQLAVPVLSHGIVETESQSGFFEATETGSKELPFDLPTNIDASKTKIELMMAPSAASAAFDALPFLAGYPYGCVEQTMSRFYPTALATDTLKKLGTDIEAIGKKMSEQNRRGSGRFSRSSVFDSAELKRMSDAGLNRLYRFQHDDGGWGWWEHDNSSPYMTAYVLLGLNTAVDSGAKISDAVFEDGVRFLIRSVDNRSFGSSSRQNERALIAYVLSLKRPRKDLQQRNEIRGLIDSVFEDRAGLNPYGQALLALALQNQNSQEKAKQVLDDILNHVENDDQQNTSWVPTSKDNWWRWYNSDVETNAWVLRAIIAVDPDKKLASRFVNWLVAQRRNGNYWRSTRDSALAVHALAEYLLFMRPESDDFTVAVQLDGEHVQDVRVSWQSMLEMESRVSFAAETLKPGKHRITLAKDDPGALHFSMVASHLVQHERIEATDSGGLRLQRRYFRLRSNRKSAEENSKPGAAVDQPRKPLEFGDQLAIGDTIEVELTISADEDFEYLAFEDPKPAGCEPVRLRSGYGWGDGLCSNVELRDSKVIFFVHWLRNGEHVLRYKLRAEVPGKFSAMPAEGFAMYTPEIRARSDEMRLIIHD